MQTNSNTLDYQVDFSIPTSTCESGGCKGADQIFGSLAGEVGHTVNHYSFQGHRWDTKCDPHTIRVLNELQLSEANKPLKQASAFLGRTTGGYQYVKNLLRRNFFQIKNTERVYAVTPIDWSSGRPEGGTGWAVTMALFRDVSEIYVFDANKDRWYEKVSWDPFERTVVWQTIEPPTPHGVYTGIGSHDITVNGKRAIEGLYR